MLSVTDLTWLDEVSSTSRLAREWIQDGRALPFAIAAGRQTAGVGRQGRTWESQSGNLHLSIALPEAAVPKTLRDLIPLAAGVIIAEWLRHSAGIALTLKWPNDLLVDGRKLGGILCEATITGDVWHGVVIGIGLNLQHVPKITDHDDYEATCVALETGRLLDPRIAAESLVRAFAEHWRVLTRESCLAKGRAMGVAPGHLWRDQGGQWWRQGPLSAAGGLCLTECVSGRTVELSSVQHGYRWQLQGARELLVADCGNTAVKIGIATRNERGWSIADYQTWKQGEDTAALKECVRGYLSRAGAPVLHAVSVSDTAYEALAKVLENLVVSVRKIRRGEVRRVDSRYDAASIGQDRAAAVEFFLARRAEHDEWSKHPGLVACCGTATTLDLVSSDGQHLGGYVGVGVQTGLNALHDQTAALPLLKIAEEKLSQDIPTATAPAMMMAAIRMQASWLDAEREELARREGVAVHRVAMMLGGGYAAMIAPLLKEQRGVVVEPLLVLGGAAILAGAGR